MVCYLKQYPASCVKDLPLTKPIGISGIHIDNKTQKMWVTLDKNGKYKEVSVTFFEWVKWIRNKRLKDIGI